MTFRFGGVSTDQLEGVTSSLRWINSFGGLTVDTVDTPGVDGRVFGGTTNVRSQFVFDTAIEAPSPDEVFERVAAFARFVDPARGARTLVPVYRVPDVGAVEPLQDWGWTATLAQEIFWSRLAWEPGTGYFVNADVTFETQGDAAGRLTVDEEFETTGSTPVEVSTRGNTRCFPMVEVRGTLSESQRVTVHIGDFSVRVDGPLSAGRVLRLDWDEYDFAVWNGTTKTSSLVKKMNHFNRPELWPEEEVQFRAVASSGGSVSSATLFPNSRRV